MTVECKECGWEGEEDALEYFKCPRCGSRNLRSEGSRKSNEESLDPPEGAMEGGMGG
ncbi:MAG: hypothetical protein SVS85_04250 [Candidatus Nanohaloarchaea archaeon]|nr:hypothetical protein [Candidatus Nanohaloarchaea archaeon]